MNNACFTINKTSSDNLQLFSDFELDLPINSIF